MRKEEVKFSGLKAEMARYGDDYESLGELLNLTKSAISRRFSGEIKWTVDEIQILCKYYNKPFEELFKTTKKNNIGG